MKGCFFMPEIIKKEDRRLKNKSQKKTQGGAYGYLYSFYRRTKTKS